MLFKDIALEQRQIGDSEFNVRWLVDNLEGKDVQWERVSKGATIKNVLVKGIGDGDGFFSRIYQIKFEFDGRNGDAYSVVLKVPLAKKITALLEKGDKTVGDGDKKALNNIVEYFHERECRFYELYEENLIAIPKVFVTRELIAGKQDGAILMESLANGARCASMFETFSMQQVERIAHQIAHLHVFSATLSEEVLEQLAEKESSLPQMLKSFRVGIQQAIGLLPTLEPLFRRIEHLTKSVEFAKYSTNGIHKELGIRPVLVHGDMHFKNIFWKTNDDNSCSSELRAIIDWQVVHPGNPGEDLAHLMVICLDPATRREAEATIFDIYYAALKNELAARKIKVPFTKDQVIKCYKRAFIGRFFFMVVFLTNLFDSYKNSTKDAPRVKRAKLETLRLKIELGFEDVFEILEREIPQWAQPKI